MMTPQAKATLIIVVSLIIGISIIIGVCTYKPVTASVSEIIVQPETNNEAKYMLTIKNKTKAVIVVHVEIELYTITQRYISTTTALMTVGAKTTMTRDYYVTVDNDYDLTYAKFVVKSIKYMEVVQGG